MKRLLVIALIFVSVNLAAQQFPVTTNFTPNEFIYNPAIAGARDSLCATALYRDKWIGFGAPDNEGAPSTALTSIHSRVGRKFGVGMHGFIHEEGFVKTYASYLSGAYHLKLKRNIGFGIGFSGGVIRKSLDPKWRPRDPADPRLPSTSTKPAFDGTLGIRVTATKWYISVSSLSVTESKLKWGTIEYPQWRSYCFTGGYNWNTLAGGRLEIAPAALIVTDFAKHSLNANLLATYKKSVFAGLGYSNSDLNTLSATVGIYIQKKFSISYAYGLATQYATVFGGTHEIMLQFTQDQNAFK